MVYGDLKFCLVEVTAKPARHGKVGKGNLVKWDFRQAERGSGSWPRLIFGAVALILREARVLAHSSPQRRCCDVR